MPKVTQAHMEARRQQILHAACVCFARKGFHQTTVQDICREAGLSPGAIYSYFSSKKDLIRALADESGRGSQILFDQIDERESAFDVLATLTQIFFAASEHTGEGEDVMDINRIKVSLWAETLRNPELVQGFREGNETVLRELTKIVHRGQQRGEFRADMDPQIAAHVLISLVEGYTLQRAFDEKLDPVRYANAMWSVLDAGLVAKARAPQKLKGQKS